MISSLTVAPLYSLKIYSLTTSGYYKSSYRREVIGHFSRHFYSSIAFSRHLIELFTAFPDFCYLSWNLSDLKCENYFSVTKKQSHREAMIGFSREKESLPKLRYFFDISIFIMETTLIIAVINMIFLCNIIHFILLFAFYLILLNELN